MIDFIFSTNKHKIGAQQSALLSCHVFDEPKIIAFSGDWGSLSVIGTPYPGFAPIETDQFIMVVLGGPLPRYDFDVANGQMPDDGTRWILNQWIIKNQIRWDDDLLGHFAILLVQKQDGVVKVVTDIDSFVPLYMTHTDDVIFHVSSHPDALAIATKKLGDIDPVSITDFLKYGAIGYPFSFYKEISQLHPATEFVIADGEITGTPYWTFESVAIRDNMREAADLFRQTLSDNVERICSGQKKVGLMLSGGEDSRIVGTLAAGATKVEAFTFIEGLNREARIASRVAGKLGIEWHPVIRDEYHYISHCDSSILLSTSTSQFIHAHTNGNIKKMPGGVRILGGLMADGFFKCASCTSRYNGTGRFIIKDKMSWEKRKVFINHPLPQLLDNEVEKRKEDTRKILSSVLPETWLDWYWFFPSTTNTSMTNVHINRRLFFSYEPFLDAQIFKLGLSIPTAWKVNGRFFHEGMHPILKRTRGILHAEGWCPYQKSRIINLMLLLPIKTIWKAIDFVRNLFGKPRKNRGPWPLWEDILNGQHFLEQASQIIEDQAKNQGDLSILNLEKRLLNGHVREMTGAFQILKWLEWREHVSGMND